MKKILIYLICIFSYVSLFAQQDVTKFLGFPVDGSKSEFIKNLKTKGFTVTKRGDNEVLSGRFNGNDVNIYLSTENGKVSRVMVCDENELSESDIKIRFNRLCDQFCKNGKYLTLEDYTIPEDEDISYEMAVRNKRYEAIFYQLPDKNAMEDLQASILATIQSQYDSEELANASDELKIKIFADCASELLKAVENKPVWFMISEHFGRYYITMFYDNELNRAQGEDL
ncbi:MAG: hypothetical protein HDS85_03875 [Bacteroidales bacterium]|nr:hypothetical protein [Bacteroidales bacterium]